MGLINVWRRAWPFFALLTLLLSLRAMSDHQFNFHYTGDNSSELALKTADHNLQRFGYVATHFFPIQYPLLENTPVDLHDPVLYYTHYGPLHYLIFSLPYLVFSNGEFAARMMAILLSMVGLWCALTAVYEWTEAFVPSETVPVLLPLAMLALNPIILCYGDNIHEQSLTEVLKWIGLLWAVRSLRRSTEPPVSLIPGIVVSFLLIYTSFEWLLPMAAVMLFVLWTTRGNPLQSPRSWAQAVFLGCFLPLAMRWGQVVWVFGGFSTALQDWRHFMQIREGGTIDYPYSVTRHIVKLFFGLLWFVGPVALLTIVVSFRRLIDDMVQGSHLSTPARRLMWLLGIWGVGSISWQFVMRQHAMFHGFTYIHPANFLIWTAAAGLIVLWTTGRTALAGALAAAQIFMGGMLAKSEIIIPFLRAHVVAEASRLCSDEAKAVLTEANNMHSSMASEISNALSAKSLSPPCGSEGRRAALWLRLLMYTVKSSSLNAPVSE